MTSSVNSDKKPHPPSHPLTATKFKVSTAAEKLQISQNAQRKC
jgi:hypothetical protein